MSSNERFFRIFNTPKNAFLFTVKHDNTLRNQQGVLLHSSLPFAVSSCSLYGQDGVFSLFSPSRGDCRHPPREMGFLCGVLSSARTQKRFPFSYSTGFASYVNEARGRRRREERRQRIESTGTFLFQRPSNSLIEKERPDYVDRDIESFPAWVDQEEDDASASWTSSFYSRSWLKDKDKQSVRIVPSSAGSSCGAPLPPLFSSSTNFVNSTGRYDGNSLLKDTLSRTPDGVCTLRASHAPALLSAVASPSTSLAGERRGDTVTSPGRDSHAPSERGYSESGEKASASGIPSAGQERYPPESLDSKPFSTRAIGVSEVSPTTYAEVYVRQISTTPLTEQEERTISLVWRDLLNEKKLCHYLQKYWDIPLFLLRSSRFHQECISYLKDNVSGKRPSDLARNASPSSSASCLPRPSVEICSAEERSGTPDVGRKKRVSSKAMRHLSLQHPYSFPAACLARTPHAEDITRSDHPNNLQRTLDDIGDVRGQGRRKEESYPPGEAKNVLRRDRRENTASFDCVEECEAEAGDQPSQELSLSFRSKQCLFLLKQLRSVASGCIPPPLDSRRETSTRPSPGVCTPEEKMISSIDVPKTARTDTGQFSTAEEKTLYSDKDELLATTGHEGLYEETFTLLRHLSEDGSEDEKRRRRQEGEGSGHLIDDKDSPKVFPKLLSPRNACRFAPLLTLARLVLSDRYASYLLILKNLRRYADLRMPSSFYPSARQSSRQVFIHAGPPNSGKTAEAVKALLAAPTGCYLAPLRLLAWEVYTRLKREGKKVSLITGQERRICRGQTHVCCTIEAAPLLQRFTCGVIDEAQILASSQRGDAWTRALLALQVEELHVCSDERAIPLLERMIHSCNDALTIQRYQRLSPLRVEDRPLESLEQLETGDCLICFTRSDVLSLKVKLESLGYNVCLVYGQLPPRVKQAQARRFNEAVSKEYQFEQLTKEATRQAPDGEGDEAWYDNDVRSLPLSSSQGQDPRGGRNDDPFCLSGQKGRKSGDRETSKRRRSLERVRLGGAEEGDNRGRERGVEECQLFEGEENSDSDDTHNSVTQDKKKPLSRPTLRHERLNKDIDSSKKEREGTAPSFVKSSLSDPAPSATDLSSPPAPSVIQLRDLVTSSANSPSSLLQDFLSPSSSSSSSSLQHAVKKQKTVLISTDAVGLGLNLNIRRVVFWKLYKFAGNSEGALRPLTIPEIRQLAGRAGRHGRVYGTEGGRVTCFSTQGAAENSDEDQDFTKIKEALSGSDPLPPLKAAALLPSIPQLLLFCDEMKRLRALDEREGEGFLPSRRSSGGHSSHVAYVEAFKMFCELAEIDEGYFLPRHKLNVMLTAIHALSDLTLCRHQLFTFALAPLPLSTPIAFLKENRSPEQLRKKDTPIASDPEYDRSDIEERRASLKDTEIEDGKDGEAEESCCEMQHEPEDGSLESGEVYDVEVEEYHGWSNILFASQNGVATALGSGMTDSFLRAYRTFALLLGTCGVVPLPPEYALGQTKTKEDRVECADSCSTHAEREEKQAPLEEVDYLGRSTDDTFERRDRKHTQEDERKQHCTGGEKPDGRSTTKDIWRRVATGEEGQESGDEFRDDGLRHPRVDVRRGALGRQQSTSLSLNDITVPRSFQVSSEGREKEETGDDSVNHHVSGLASPMVTEGGDQRKEELTKRMVEYLTQLEEHYQVLDLYRWLSMKYPEAFVDIQLAIMSQAHIGNLIEVCLNTPWEKLGERGIRDQLRVWFSDPHDTAHGVAQLVSWESRHNEVSSSDRMTKESVESLDTSPGPSQVYRYLAGVCKEMPSASQGPMQSTSDTLFNNRAGVSRSGADRFGPGNFDTSANDREFEANDVRSSQQSHFSAFLAALNDSRHLFDGAVNPEKAFSQAVRNVLLEQQSGETATVERRCASVLDCAYTTVIPGQVKETNGGPYGGEETERLSLVSREASFRRASKASAVNPLDCASGDCIEQAGTRDRLRTGGGVTLSRRKAGDNNADNDESRYPSRRRGLPSERVDDEEKSAPGKEEKEGVSMEVILNDLREIATGNSEIGRILKQIWVACQFEPKTKLKTAETKNPDENKLFCTTNNPTQG